MIIFGMRPKHKTVGEGRFFCPRCQAMRPYKHQQATRYFTLYFIPVVPMGKMGEFIECQGCGAMFEMQVLQQKVERPARPAAASLLAQQINAIPARLRMGVPVEYIVRDLTSSGIDRDAALALVNPHLANGTRTCATCGLTYAEGVDACAECNKPL